MSIDYSLNELNRPVGAGREMFVSWRASKREPMTDQTKPEIKPSGRMVTRAELKVEEWFLFVETDFDDDDPNPPPIRGRPPPKPYQEVSFPPK
jgi:hypothetical protein